MSLWSWLIGGPDNSAQDAQIAANKEAFEFIKQQAEQARNDALALSPGATANRGMGYQGAFDVLGQTIPQQFDTFQQGNMGAQSTLLAGLDQFQNAIMGRPVDMSAMQPKAINYNTDWAQQQVPDFLTAADLLGGNTGGGGGGQIPDQTFPDGTATDTRDQYNIGREMQNQHYMDELQRRADIASAGRHGPSQHGGTYDPYGWESGYRDNWNASDIDKLFGYKDIGSLDQLNAFENMEGGGKLLSLLSGIPGLGWLGGKLGDKLIGDRTWMNPVDATDPYGQYTVADDTLNEFIQNPEGLDRSSIRDGNTATIGGQQGMYGPGSYGANVGPGHGGRFDLGNTLGGSGGWGGMGWGSYGGSMISPRWWLSSD